ncbi:MAG: biotin--[acetyl-CoA-carboxylase] ligase [Planctomycetota bacterium]|nr:biotin--[acetyl-CoA-carboxylase] ligase [Planctomycetota bacterium]
MQPVSPSSAVTSAAAGAAGVDPIDLQRLMAVGRLATVEHLHEAESTMHRGRGLAATPQTSTLPAVVLADRQTDGRGRRGAGWWQASGSLAMTVVVDPVWLGWPASDGPSPAAAGWSLACGIALAESLMAVVPTVMVGLRWPNDVEVGGRKLAGILAEASSSGRVLFGIGVNTAGRIAEAPLPLRDRLVTIPDLIGEPLPRQQLLEAFLPRLWEMLTALATDSGVLRQRYAPLCTLTGARVTFHHGQEQVSGVCLGIDADGALCMQTAEGERRFHGGSLTPQSSQWRPAPSFGS